MPRHQRRTPSRVGLGTVIVGTVLSLLLFGISPAQATADARSSTPSSTHSSTHSSTRSSAPIHSSVLLLDPPCGPGVNVRAATRCAGGPQQISEGGCGFLQRCVWLSRGEQLVILAGGSATIVALICGATVLLGCATASAVVAAALQWLSNRGGICPVSRPRLRVQYFPIPSVEGCVA